MRTLTGAFAVSGLLVASSAAAQQADPAPPVVQMDNAAAGASAPAADTPPPAAAEGAAAPATPPPSGENSSAVSTVGGAASSNDWKFEFHGYFRAPMRMGFGHNGGCPLCTPAENTTPAGQNQNSIHYPIVPDGQYLSWQYTGVQSSDWSELFFTYGNQLVKGTVGLQGYNFTDAAWQQSSAQFGIAQGWLTFTPKTGYQNVHVESKVGAFWSKYGMAGKYDAGKYDTYLFGRTHQMGETAKIGIDIDKVTLWAEEGFGAKQPDPSMYNPSKFSLLAHGHAGMTWNRMLSLNVHFLYAWAQEEDRPANVPTYTGVTSQPNLGLPDGNVIIGGPELILRGTLVGDFYLGWSHIALNNATVVDDVVEVIHSSGGQVFQQGLQGNYLDGPKQASKGNGNIDTVLLQYDFSLANLLAGIKKEAFYGDGPDLGASFFLMFNHVSDDPDPSMNGVNKLKYGVDFIGTPIKWLGLALRYDRVQPNSNIPEQSYSIVSPRLVFKSAFLTHEEVIVQYSRYVYNQRACPATDATLCAQPPSAPTLPNGFGTPVASLDPNQRGAPNIYPDLNTLKVQASMWW